MKLKIILVLYVIYSFFSIVFDKSNCEDKFIPLNS